MHCSHLTNTFLKNSSKVLGSSFIHSSQFDVQNCVQAVSVTAGAIVDVSEKTAVLWLLLHII